MEYIEMDDDELLYSDFDDKTLQLIQAFLGPEVRDKLLVVNDVRPTYRYHINAV